MEKMTCETCKHKHVSPFYEPCHTCIDRAVDSGSLATLWEPYSDCDTCQHHNTPDLMHCIACTSVAALTGERWTLHVPAMPPKPSARTIPITSVSIAAPGPVSQVVDPIATASENPRDGASDDLHFHSLILVAAVFFIAGISFGLAVAAARG